jgi:chromate transport protein ChrA
MFGLSIGVSNIGDSLPDLVYALLSGLNAATVGVIALAAVQLSEKCITDKLTRVLVFLSAAAGMLYNALWYFPVLMVTAGIVAILYDYRWLHGPVKAIVGLVKLPKRRRRALTEQENVDLGQQHLAEGARDDGKSPVGLPSQAEGLVENGTKSAKNDERREPVLPVSEYQTPSSLENEPRIVPAGRQLNISWRIGLLIIMLFLLSFVVVMILRGVLPQKSLLFSLFANMYLAGTIIFGGGPVVIPLLREYVVAEGWVSPRDFLIGLAIIQSFPGPNFNFAVYLGSLTAINGGYVSAAGAVIGFVGIFAPGLILVHGTMGVWSAVRGLRYVKSAVRGINAAAVGLIYTAVYRLWQIGYIAEGFQQGTSLAAEPWWVVVTATSYVGGYWFGVSAPVAIITGAVMGLIWYGVVST